MGVDGLSGSNDNRLNAHKRERSIDKSREEAQKVTSRASDAVVVYPRSRVTPIPEANGLVIGSSSSRDDNGHDDEANEAENLDGTGYHFCFSKEAHVHEVDG